MLLHTGGHFSLLAKQHSCSVFVLKIKSTWSSWLTVIQSILDFHSQMIINGGYTVALFEPQRSCQSLFFKFFMCGYHWKTWLVRPCSDYRQICFVSAIWFLTQTVICKGSDQICCVQTSPLCTDQSAWVAVVTMVSSFTTWKYNNWKNVDELSCYPNTCAVKSWCRTLPHQTYSVTEQTDKH